MLVPVQILGIGLIIGMIVGFVALLVPSIRIVGKAGFHAAWAWLACLLYCGGYWGHIALTGWAGVYTDRQEVVRAIGPYVNAIPALTALAALWGLAFIGWPALRRATAGQQS